MKQHRMTKAEYDVLRVADFDRLEAERDAALADVARYRMALATILDRLEGLINYECACSSTFEIASGALAARPTAGQGGGNFNPYGLDPRATKTYRVSKPVAPEPVAAGHQFVPMSGTRQPDGRYARCSVNGCDVLPEEHPAAPPSAPSGFIPDPTSGVSFEMRCFACGQPIDMDDCPINQHHECLQKDGRLAVTVTLENYDAR